MKIFIAGATGAIGQPLISSLRKKGHEVHGITQSKERASILSKKGAYPVVLDVLNRQAVLTAVEEIRPDVIVNMLTRLPKDYTPQAMKEAAEMDAILRKEGSANLLAAAEKYHVKRYIAQSCGFWYEPGKGLADENTSLALHSTPSISARSKLYLDLEEQMLQIKNLTAISLRFGFFYGPGTWYHPGASMADQILQGKVAIIGKGQGVWNFVHIEDAAESIVLAIDAPAGIYNIVNDSPSKMSEWLPAFARYLKAPAPPHILEEEALKQNGEDSVYYATMLRGASNAKAKKVMNFRPRAFEWLAH